MSYSYGFEAKFCNNHGLCSHTTAECWGIPWRSAARRRMQWPQPGQSPAPVPNAQVDEPRPCIYCGKRDHARQRCPRIATSSSYFCFNCCRQGHLVQNCEEPLSKMVIDYNYREFLKCLMTKKQFRPTRNVPPGPSCSPSTAPRHDDDKDGDGYQLTVQAVDQWKSQDVADVCRDLPLPGRMTIVGENANMLRLEFQDATLALEAFDVLQGQGRIVQANRELVKAPVAAATQVPVPDVVQHLQVEVQEIKQSLTSFQSSMNRALGQILSHLHLEEESDVVMVPSQSAGKHTLEAPESEKHVKLAKT